MKTVATGKPTAIVKVQSAIASIQKIAAGVQELRERHANVVFDVTQPAGMRLAKQIRAEVREPRFEVERVRIEAKRDLLAVGRGLDQVAAAITADILKIEGPIDERIKAEEKRQEDIAEAKRHAEAKRVAMARDIISRLLGIPLLAVNKSSDVIRDLLAKTDSVEIGPDMAEFESTAIAAKRDAIAALAELLTARTEWEVEQARVEAQRVENERVAAENRERQRIADEARDAAAKVERERLAEERKKNERDRLDNEIAAKALEDGRAAVAATERPHVVESARSPAYEHFYGPKAPVRPSVAMIVDAISELFKVSKPVALAWLCEIDWENVSC